ncbi:hypothetical protein QA584_05545 [Anaerocolumna sp. AGMB13025]|uniref:hypothetical protein n=1 Tax=Anaerocolumna sp. AGMB13025 TaxID=3039116 RepID=UPI00241ED35C|nr:hypothetical protein [Anaerocolumna sp. AGMB13025]WFR58537.1 hypothetical protein QA584_05545 [Anaerocolumna sp. AGMB13025]
MSDFILEYDILESIAKYSNALGKRAEEYKESLEKRMLSGIGNITGPSSRYLLDASDSVRDKMNELKQKSETFYNFAKQIVNLLVIAEQIDQEVADAITAQREYLLEHHESLRLQNFKVKLLELLIEIENLIPLLSTIAASLRELEVKQESLEETIKNWYKKPGNVFSDLVKTETTAWTLFCRKIDGQDFSYLKNTKQNDKVDYEERIKQYYNNPMRQRPKKFRVGYTYYEWDLYNAKKANNPIEAAIYMGKYFWDRWPGLFGQYMTRNAENSGIDTEWAKIAGDFSSGIFLEGFMAITVNGVKAFKNLRTGEIVYGDTVLGSGMGSTTKGTKAGSGAIEETGANAVKGAGKPFSVNETTKLLDDMPELIGSTREKLLSAIQNKKLSEIVKELYRRAATTGDGGTASRLMEEFYQGSSAHLQKSIERVKQLNDLISSGKLGLNDLDIAEALITDLENAIKLFE